MEQSLADHDVKVHASFEPEQQKPWEELITNLMALIASFSGRDYGLRAAAHRIY